MTLAPRSNEPFTLHLGPVWERFEDIRVGAAEKLSKIRNGTIGILKLKQRQYRILCEDDFQRLLGSAADAEMLRREVQLIIQAAEVVNENNSDASRKMLQMIALQISEKVYLPSIDGSQSFDLEKHDIDREDDDSSLNMRLD
ncbi:hypothetical protein [Deinococcus yunweiensis]|uniref:hypothetical protein n=1 Tax=Deinococcus yunweiensis TaxID=367282 RepID=UPI00398E65F3